jgi:hypothetical protein
MRRQKRLTRNQRRNKAYEDAQAHAMEAALSFDPVAFDLETLGPITGRRGSSQPNLQYIPRLDDFYAQLQDMALEHRYASRGLPTPQRLGGPGTLVIVDDPLARTDYAELERRVLEQAFGESKANTALVLSSYGDELPDDIEQVFEKVVADGISADVARAAAKIASFAAVYGGPPLKLIGGKINGTGPAYGLGRLRRP